MIGRLFLDYFPSKGISFCYPAGLGFVFFWEGEILGKGDVFDMLITLYGNQR